jgi:hypothetical protein
LITRDTSPEALSEGMLTVLDNRPALDRAAQVGRRLVVDTMGWDAVADRYLELYDEVRRGR